MGIISSKICRMYPIMVCKREFYINLLVINTQGFDMILGMDWLSTFHAVINCPKRSVVFMTSKHLKFEFIRHNSIIESAEFKACSTEGVLAHLDAILIEIVLVSEFMNVFENFMELLPNRIVEFATNLISGIAPISYAIY